MSANGVRTTMRRPMGLVTRVLEAGDPEAEEAVVCLHGAPGSADHWAALLDRFAAAGGRAVAFDLPGYGAAARPPEADYSPSYYANFVAAAIDDLHIRQAHLVMNDVGGFGLVWAASHPSAFASATLVNTGIWVGMRRWHAVGELFRAPVLGAIAERAGRFAFTTVIGFYSGLDRSTIAPWRAEYDRAQRRAVHRMFRATPPDFGRTMIPALRDLDRPALVVWGGRDRFIDVAQADRQRACFPRADVVILDELGHYPHIEDADAVADVVVPFLQTHVRAVDRPGLSQAPWW